MLRVDINREFGDVIFEPISGPGEYHVSYMPYVLGGRANYPTMEYLLPNPTAEEAWVVENARHCGLSSTGHVPPR